LEEVATPFLNSNGTGSETFGEAWPGAEILAFRAVAA
jgi:hypothetical protein